MTRVACRLFLRTALPLWFAAAAAAQDNATQDNSAKDNSAQQWTRFRGPNGAGIGSSTTIPTTWTTDDYRWRVKLPGIGYSSPVVWKDRIFVTSAIEEDATRILRCLDTADGRLIWKQPFPSTTYRKNRLNGYAAATPAVDRNHVYIMWTTPEEFIVLAVTQDKGREVWRRDLGPYTAMHGSGASPIVFEDTLIVPNEQGEGSFAICLECATGSTRWKTELPVRRGGYATPCIYRPDEGPLQLVLAGSEYGLISLDPKTGRMNWHLQGFPARVVGSPVIAAGLIFGNCGQGGGGKRLIAVKPANPANGAKPRLVYDNTRSMPYVPTPVASGKLLFLFADSGVVTCIDAPSGEIHWQQRLDEKFFGSPVRVADRIYCISRGGRMIVLAAEKKYKLLAKIDLEEPSNSTPAVADGVMYLRTASHLMAIGG